MVSALRLERALRTNEGEQREARFKWALGDRGNLDFDSDGLQIITTLNYIDQLQNGYIK